MFILTIRKYWVQWKWGRGKVKERDMIIELFKKIYKQRRVLFKLNQDQNLIQMSN